MQVLAELMGISVTPKAVQVPVLRESLPSILQAYSASRLPNVHAVCKMNEAGPRAGSLGAKFVAARSKISGKLMKAGLQQPPALFKLFTSSESYASIYSAEQAQKAAATGVMLGLGSVPLCLAVLLLRAFRGQKTTSRAKLQ